MYTSQPCLVCGHACPIRLCTGPVPRRDMGVEGSVRAS